MAFLSRICSDSPRALWECATNSQLSLPLRIPRQDRAIDQICGRPAFAPGAMLGLQSRVMAHSSLPCETTTMQRNIGFLATAALVSAFGLASARAADKVNLENLLPQMTDLSRLCEYPDPPYVTKQFSSYDRASEKSGVPSWFANGDHSFMLYDGVIKENVPFFKREPVPGLPEEGHFPPGTRVG